MISPARQVAFDVLRKVQQGGYASDLLLQRSTQLDSRDAGLASEIVFGCLRYQFQLDFLIARRIPRSPDPEVVIALRMGIYQLRYLDRIPPHAAVGESVELVKRAHKASAAGLVIVRERFDKGFMNGFKDRLTSRKVEFQKIRIWAATIKGTDGSGLQEISMRNSTDCFGASEISKFIPEDEMCTG